MDLWLAALIILGAAAASAAGMLIVRRRAPAGTVFRDAIPAGAVYTVVGTAYMVIVAFVFFVAFESYHEAKSAAQDEATAMLAMFHAVEPFDQQARARLQGQVVCYAREVISKQWPTMRDGKSSPVVDARISEMEREAEGLPVRGAKQAAAYEHWFALSEDRRSGRQGRLAEATPLVPPLVWLILITGAVLVIAGVAFFADSDEARVPQAVMIVAVAVIVVSGLLLVRFLDKPYENQSGSIKPTAMTRSLELMQRENQQRNRHPVVRCAPSSEGA